jgi:hypothetical protein
MWGQCIALHVDYVGAVHHPARRRHSDASLCSSSQVPIDRTAASQLGGGRIRTLVCISDDLPTRWGQDQDIGVVCISDGLLGRLCAVALLTGFVQWRSRVDSSDSWALLRLRFQVVWLTSQAFIELVVAAAELRHLNLFRVRRHLTCSVSFD